jgi:hypothetical protein
MEEKIPRLCGLVKGVTVLIPFVHPFQEDEQQTRIAYDREVI